MNLVSDEDHATSAATAVGLYGIGAEMSGSSSDFGGNIATDYDQGLGPIIFAGYASDMAARVVAVAKHKVLETASGTGIVTRAIRDALPAGVALTATDLNPGMMTVAQAKFRSDEQVTLQPADGNNLPFPDSSFDTMVCQFGMMLYPDEQGATGRRIAFLT